MVDDIVSYLQTCGFDATIEDDENIITKHQLDGKHFTIVGKLTKRSIPIFFLRERSKYGSLAHVGWDKFSPNDDGLICEGVDINRHVDYSEPHIVYVEALIKAIDIIIKDLLDSSYNYQEIINEFTAHWRFSSNNENQKVISFIEPSKDVEDIEIFAPMNPSQKSNHFFVKGQSIQINSEYEYLNNLVKKSHLKGKAIYIPFNFSYLPPNPNTVLMDWWSELIRNLPGKMQGKLRDISRRNHCKEFWILGSVKTNEDSLGWFCIRFDNPIKTIPPLFTTHNKETWNAEAYDVKIHSKKYILPRGGAVLYEEEKTVAVIGCGSVGSEIARQLASIGVSNIILVDFDNLEIANVYRHFLSPEFIGEDKATVLALDLKKRYPYTNITVVPQKRLDSCLTNDFLASVQGIIVATGSPTEERYFNEQLIRYKIRPWVIYCWVEGHGVGGHAVYVHTSGKGCLNCLYKDSNGKKSLESIQNFLKSQQELAIDIAGCGTHFLPYSFTDAIQTAILAIRLALLAVENKLKESCRISWKNSNANGLGLKTTHRYRVYRNSLNLEPLYWNYCDVCNI
jgi:molybdopterin/thiamine biosynthesis adenylyltransferase